MKKSDAQVLKYNTNITIDSKGTKTTKRTILVQINNKTSNWLSHIEIHHDPKQQLDLEYANIIDANGNVVRKFKKKDLVTRNDLSYQAFYQDDLISEFDLYWNEYPYVIEYAYTIVEEEYLMISRWTPFMFTNVSTLESSLEVNVPTGYKLHFQQFGDLTYSKEESEGATTYKWNSEKVNKLEYDIYALPVEERISMVLITPSSFVYGVEGKTDSWADFGLWLSELNKGLFQLPASEHANIKKMIEGVSNEKEIIKTLYYYLQDETRYINVAIDVGGLKSYPAEYVCKNKYGDCKALTTYMKAMLDYAEIDSYYTIINGGQNEARVLKEIPGQQFNHVILCIPLKNDTIWLENTSNVLPFDYVHTSIQNRLALAINNNQSELVITPRLSAKDVLVERDYKIEMNEVEECQGHVGLRLRGAAFEYYRSLISEDNKEDVEEAIRQQINIEGFDLAKWETTDFHRDSTIIKLVAKGTLPSPIRNIGSWRVINPLKIAIPDFKEPGERKLDVRLNYPINKMDSLEYHFEGLDKLDIQIPESILLESPYGLYSANFKRKENTLYVQEHFILNAMGIPLANYPDFYEFIKSIKTYKKKTAILLK